MGARMRARLWGFVLAVLGASLSSCEREPAADGGGAGSAAVGVSVHALSQPPESNCASFVNAGKQWWFCPTGRTWLNARMNCQAIGLDLGVVTSAAESSLVQSHAADAAWLGGSDQGSEGVWKWEPTNTQFWQGASNGSVVGGAFTNWQSLQPNSSIED